MDPLKMYVLLKMGIFHCFVSLPEVFFFKRGYMGYGHINKSFTRNAKVGENPAGPEARTDVL